MKKFRFVLALAAFAMALPLFGCDTGTSGVPDPKAIDRSAPSDTSATIIEGDPPKPEPKPVVQKGGSTAAPGAKMPATGEEVAVIDTNHGQIILKFFPKVAPNHVKNFKDLAKKGFYDGTTFHRVIPGFMIQGGDPNSKTGQGQVGTGGPGYSVKAEFNSTKHTRGILSMARSNDPDSAGSQFFIMVDTNSQLDGQYTAFGQVVKGMDVVDKIVELPRDSGDKPYDPGAVMKSVKIVKWPVK